MSDVVINHRRVEPRLTGYQAALDAYFQIISLHVDLSQDSPL